MSLREEAERIGFGLAAAGTAFLGTIAALFSMGLLGLNSGAPVFVFAAFLVGGPVLLVVTTLTALRIAAPFRLFPLITGLGTIVGGFLSLPFFQTLGFTGLLGMPTLLTFATFMISQFLNNRPGLSGSEIGLHSAASLAFYSIFAVRPLSIVLGLIDTRGCEGCGTNANLITAIVVLSFAAVVILAAATRYRRSARPTRGAPA